jgi:hypothetical protein
MSPREEAFLISEANGSRSRDMIVGALAPGSYVPGTIICTSTGIAAVRSNQNSDSDDTDDGDVSPGPYGVLLRSATDADEYIVVIARDAEVDGSLLVFSEAGGVMTAGQKAAVLAGLASAGIVVR